ncbi:MAG: polysaccharide deacetylase family protein [Anaerolineales bacterium]|nr:polysaccharide deacetylase family protein [Anaerolineales bacterium]
MNQLAPRTLLIIVVAWLVALALALPALADFQPPTADRRPLLRTWQVLTVGSPSSAVLTGTLPFTTEIRPTGYVKGLYITYYGLGSETHRTRVQELLENTELNAIVMDVKGDFGWLPYSSTVQTALDIGAGNRPMIQDWAAWMQWFKERNIYTIARIVVFKDDPLAAAYPEWAVLDSASGGVWHDREGLGWVDPSREEVWDYNIALAVEAAGWGFDEIQFDYVRFPTDGQISRATFAVENTQENRLAAISGFLAKAREALAPYPVKVAVDVFGYTTWREDDMNIGQQIETLAPYLDVLSPMLYPSTFADGLPGLPAYRQAVAFPYEIVNKSTFKAVERLKTAHPELELRPWIQDFSDYAFDGRTYTPEEIRLQMEGARQAGGRGWLLWDPRVKYTGEALVSAQPVYPPRLNGQVLVLEYHLIGEPEDRWQRTPANFRTDLERLRAEGYYPVNLRDLAAGDLGMVPAGKRPVVLTFDDSSIEQFRLRPDGSVDPNCAIGILLDFHAAHPADWPLRATFFVLQDVDAPERILFGQLELAQQKLQMLVNWGMEVGSHTLSHANLAESSPGEVKRQLALSQAKLEELLPGYEVVSLSIPFGAYPRDERLLVGGLYEDILYTYKAAVEVSGGLAPSPHAPDFDPFHIPRVQAIQSELDYWLNYANQAGVSYVSAGE